MKGVDHTLEIPCQALSTELNTIYIFNVFATIKGKSFANEVPGFEDQSYDKIHNYGIIQYIEFWVKIASIQA